MRRPATLVFAVVLLSLLGGAREAAAAMPWWHLNTVSAPASAPGGESTLLVEASDLGDAYVNGSEHPVRLVEKLPAGVSATTVYGEGGGTTFARDFAKLFMSCSLQGEQLVTCTYSGPLLAYERLMIRIIVKVAPGGGSGQNEVSISGGGAPSVVSRRALALGGSPSPYGVENYEMTPEEEGGTVDTQAGSHPFQLTTTLGMNAQTVPADSEYRDDGVLSEVEPRALTKDLRFNLPAGLVGNPTPLPQCSTFVFTQQSFGHGVCPADSVVGVAAVVITNPGNQAQVPWEETRALYNLTPSVGEPARFGFFTAGVR